MMVNPNEINSFFYRLYSPLLPSLPFSPYNSDVNQSFNPPNVPTDDVHTPRIVHTRTPSGLLLSAIFSPIFSLSLSLSSSSLFILPSFGGWWVHGPVGGSAIPAPSLIIFPPACVRVCVCGRSKILFQRLTPSDFNFFNKIIITTLICMWKLQQRSVSIEINFCLNRVPPVGLDDPLFNVFKINKSSDGKLYISREGGDY